MTFSCGLPRDLPDALRQAAQRELAPGEQVAWAAQPVPALFARGSLPVVWFAIPWTAFSIFWMTGAAQGSIYFALFGLPFVLIGLGMLSLPAWKRYCARHSLYVITDRRALCFVRALRELSVRSFPPEQLGKIDRKETGNGAGMLVFTQDVSRDSDGDPVRSDVGFLGVHDAKRVHDLLLALHARGFTR
jgi:hypothetical protein